MDNATILIFKIQDYCYGINVSYVLEVITKIGQIAPIPGAPPYIKGLINWHNSILPLIDLSSYWKLSYVLLTQQSRILIMEVAKMRFGLLIEDVVGIYSKSGLEISQVTADYKEIDHSVLLGIGKIAETRLKLIDIEKLALQLDWQQVKT